MGERAKSGNSAREGFNALPLYLSLGLCILIVLLLGFAGWGLSAQIRKHGVQQIRSEMLTHIDYLKAQFTIDVNAVPEMINDFADPRFNAYHSGLYWQVDLLNHNGETLRTGIMRSPSLQGFTLRLPEHDTETGVINQRRIIGPTGAEMLRTFRLVTSITPLAAPARNRVQETPLLTENVKVRLIIAADEAKLMENIDDFNQTLWLIFLLIAVIVVAFEMAQLFLVHLPFQQLYRSLAAVRSGEDSQLEGKYPGRMQALVEEFNRLLMQNTAVLNGTRKQVGNLAKAVRPPLDTMFQAAGEKDQTLESLSSVVSTQVNVAHQQINSHLVQSQAVALALKAKLRCEVFSVLENMVRRLEKVYADKQLTLSIRAEKPYPFFRGEMQDLRDIFGNLLNKACQWAQHTVQIQLVSSERHFLVVIEDDGLGMAVEHNEKDAQAASTALPDNKQVPGAELELAELRELLALYNSRLEQRHSKLGGIQARLILPRAS